MRVTGVLAPTGEPGGGRVVRRRRLTVDGAGAGQPGGELPGVHGDDARAAGRRAQPAHRGGVIRHGRGGRSISTAPATARAGASSTRRAARARRRTWRTAQTFISDAHGVVNYTGSIEDVFRCIAPLGDVGCAFEQPFGADARAGRRRDGTPPAENQGFLRDDARLAIVMLTNEDDCSPRAARRCSTPRRTNRWRRRWDRRPASAATNWAHCAADGAAGASRPTGASATCSRTTAAPAEDAGMLNPSPIRWDRSGR